MIIKAAVLKMNYLVFTRQDAWILYIVLPPYLITVNYLLLGEKYLSFPFLITATLLSCVIGTCSWATHIIAANILRNIISGYSRTVQRILVQLPVYVVLTLALGLSLFGAFHFFGFIDSPLTWSSFRSTFIAGIMLNVVATSFHEGLFAFNKWKTTTLETEQLKKNYLQSQLEGLKSQVNPHFLFNSLNSLSALIYNDQEKAGVFLDEMSKVYRYLLKSNESELIALSAEIQFVHSFFHMLKTRYGDGIELILNVQDACLDHLLPPLTLQMLIENAVKHNVISADAPLRIEIFTGSDRTLTIRNNIRKKFTKVFSNGIGLQNIITKYRLLGGPDIIIRNDDQFFIVQLPLFNHTPDHEHTHYRR